MASKQLKSTATRSKIFVLDTSVILYDHASIYSFKEHDVAIPIQVLEELDIYKSGNEHRNFEARSFIRLIDELSKAKLINKWINLKKEELGRFKVIIGENLNNSHTDLIFGNDKIDHKILDAALHLQKENPEIKVILVSKDICLRLKAKGLGLIAEDYETGKIKNTGDLYSGLTSITLKKEELLKQLTERKIIKSDDLITEKFNHFCLFKFNRKSIPAFYNAQLQTLELIDKQRLFNIQPRNSEQNCALHALLNPDIKLVTIQGNAGTGKTLLALVAALEQRKEFRQIYVTRPVIPLSNKEIGYLPGDVKSKIDPYMSPIWDNLKFIKEQFPKDDSMRLKIDNLVENEKITITPLAFIRGRTLSKIFFIVDEAQNLTPHEVKTIISRAGEDTKIVFTGDIYQIDTPYLDAESNGLSYLIANAKEHPLYAHITLKKGVRSELANLANALL